MATTTEPLNTATAEQQVTPFTFYTERRLIVLTGRKASNLQQLLNNLRDVSGSCIFYHTHVAYLATHFEKPRFYNEFANWASQSLQDERLAERLAAIDMLAIGSIRDLRAALDATIEKHLKTALEPMRECTPGEEFHFCEAKSFIMPTGQVAHTIPEFFDTVKNVSNTCVHFHFVESRLRLERPTNDFSQWLSGIGQDKLAKKIDQLNPYTLTLGELRQEIAKIGRKHR